VNDPNVPRQHDRETTVEPRNTMDAHGVDDVMKPPLEQNVSRIQFASWRAGKPVSGLAENVDPPSQITRLRAFDQVALATRGS
jgi:hypothetical protein